MSEKVAGMLRRMRADGNSDKKYWNSLPHLERGKIRTAHINNTKLIDINFLREHRSD